MTIVVGKYRPIANPFKVFAERVNVGNECWTWGGSLNRAGYGVVRLGGSGGKASLAHRLAWSLTNGPIPAGLHVLHHCDNPGCVRPDHLFLGTNADNIADRMRKGRPGSQAWRGCGERHPNAKLTDAECREIRAMRKRGFSCGYLANEYGVTKEHISAVARGIARSNT